MSHSHTVWVTHTNSIGTCHMFFWIFFYLFETSATASCGSTGLIYCNRNPQFFLKGVVHPRFQALEEQGLGDLAGCHRRNLIRCRWSQGTDISLHLGKGGCNFCEGHGWCQWRRHRGHQGDWYGARWRARHCWEERFLKKSGRYVDTIKAFVHTFRHSKCSIPWKHPLTASSPIVNLQCIACWMALQALSCFFKEVLCQELRDDAGEGCCWLPGCMPAILPGKALVKNGNQGPSCTTTVSDLTPEEMQECFFRHECAEAEGQTSWQCNCCDDWSEAISCTPCLWQARKNWPGKCFARHPWANCSPNPGLWLLVFVEGGHLEMRWARQSLACYLSSMKAFLDLGQLYIQGDLALLLKRCADNNLLPNEFHWHCSPSSALFWATLLASIWVILVFTTVCFGVPFCQATCA